MENGDIRNQSTLDVMNAKDSRSRWQGGCIFWCPLIAVMLFATGCTVASEANCSNDADCDDGQRCVSSGGLFVRDAVCVDRYPADENQDTSLQDIPRPSIPDVRPPGDVTDDDAEPPDDVADVDITPPDIPDTNPPTECTTGDECPSQICIDGQCAHPTCDDDIQNGDETDVDCGGPDCPPCDHGQGCIDDEDCVSGVCRGQTCSEPTCDDGVQNGDETDVDCGGPDCPPCSVTMNCEIDDDCAAARCGNLGCYPFVYTSGHDGAVRKFDAHGNEVLTHEFEEAVVGGLVVDPDGYLYAGVGTGGNPGVGRVIKLAPQWQELWSHPTPDGFPRDVAVNVDNSVAVAIYNGVVRLLDSGGQEQWTSGDNIQGINVAIDADGDVYFGGFAGADLGHMYKFDATGEELWEFPAGMYFDVDPSGHTYATVGATGWISQSDQLLKIDPQGELLWESQEFDGAIRHVTTGPGQWIYLATQDGTVHKLDGDGQVEWTFDEIEDEFWGVAVDFYGNVYASTLEGLLVMLDADGQLLWDIEAHDARLWHIAVEPGDYSTFFEHWPEP